MDNKTEEVNEKWVKIVPKELNELYPEENSGGFWLAEFIQKVGIGTTIKLDYKESLIEIHFTDALVARVANESERLRTWQVAQINHNYELTTRNFLCKVKNSELIEWLEEESLEIYNENNMTHYCMILADDVIDIVSSFPPEIKFSKEVVKDGG